MASGCAKAKISATLISTVLHFNIVATFPALVVLFTLLFRKVLNGFFPLFVVVSSYLVILFILCYFAVYPPSTAIIVPVK